MYKQAAASFRNECLKDCNHLYIGRLSWPCQILQYLPSQYDKWDTVEHNAMFSRWCWSNLLLPHNTLLVPALASTSTAHSNELQSLNRSNSSVRDGVVLLQARLQHTVVKYTLCEPKHQLCGGCVVLLYLQHIVMNYSLWTEAPVVWGMWVLLHLQHIVMNYSLWTEALVVWGMCGTLVSTAHSNELQSLNRSTSCVGDVWYSCIYST